MFSLLDASTSGLTANKLFMSTVSDNIANMQSTRGSDGKIYKRQSVQFSEFKDVLNSKFGVKADKINEENREDRLVYDPSHPDADANGNVHYPDINIEEEMSDMLTAQRGYQLNLSTLNIAKEIYKQTLDIGK